MRPTATHPARALRAAALVLLGLAAGLPASSARAGPAGVIPQGLWVLNQARSQELSPGAQTLWIIKDDGRFLVWVNAATDDQGHVRVSSFDGPYGGSALVRVVGAPIRARVIARGPGAVRTEGEIDEVGPYAEDCQVMPGGRRFVCHGQVAAKDGVRRWVDDFDWAGPSPSP